MKKSGKKPIVEFVNKLFESREKAHVFHLQTKSYEYHVALDSYYKEIIEFIDEFVEVLRTCAARYQGQYDIIEDYDLIVSDSKERDAIKYLSNLVSFISNERYDYIDDKDSHLHNIIDEIVALIYKTLYKLKHLK